MEIQDQKTINDIMLAIGEIKGKMDGMIQLQNVANGRTFKIEGKVELLEKRSDIQDGTIKGIGKTITIMNAIWGIFIGLGGFIVAFTTFWFKK